MVETRNVSAVDKSAWKSDKYIFFTVQARYFEVPSSHFVRIYGLELGTSRVRAGYDFGMSGFFVLGRLGVVDCM